MYKKSHDMDNAMKILDLSFNERRSYLASSVDFFYVPLLILKTILRFSEKRWQWQLKGSYTSLVMWKILPWGTNKINISRFSSNQILRCFFGIAINSIKHLISEGSLLLKCSVLFGSVVLSLDPSSIVTSLMKRQWIASFFVKWAIMDICLQICLTSCFCVFNPVIFMTKETVCHLQNRINLIMTRLFLTSELERHP